MPPWPVAAEHFEMPRVMRWLYWLAPGLTAGVAVILAMLPFTAADDPQSCHDNSALLAWVAVLGGGAFGLLTLGLLGPARRVGRTATSVDDDGLWATRDGKAAGLVPWTHITALRDRPLVKRLELLDAAGHVRASLECVLTDFSRLRMRVLERAALPPVAMPPDGVVRQPWSSRALRLAGAAGMAALCLWLQDDKPWTAYGGAAFFFVLGAWDFATTPSLLRLRPESLEVVWPFRQISITRANVWDISVEDDPQQPLAGTVVAIRLAPDVPPLVLRGLKTKPAELYRLLRAWQAGPR
jgi:hypothetical protein